MIKKLISQYLLSKNDLSILSKITASLFCFLCVISTRAVILTFNYFELCEFRIHKKLWNYLSKGFCLFIKCHLQNELRWRLEINFFMMEKWNMRFCAWINIWKCFSNACEMSKFWKIFFRTEMYRAAVRSLSYCHVCVWVCVSSRGDCGSLLWTQGHEVTLNHWILTDSLAIFLQGITPPLRVTVNVYRVHQQGLQQTPEKSLLNITQPLKAFNRHVTQAQHNPSVPSTQ